MFALAATALLAATAVRAQVTATAPNGRTNPSAPAFMPVGSYVNQTSNSRLISLNGVDDFCLWGPPEPGPDSLIGNVEPIVVAYCTKPRNNARLIPDGVITAAHYIKTPLYVQIYGFWDGTKVNIPYGDSGGELDPWGAENVGNPIGGNATSSVSGQDVWYMQWMSFISYDQYCLRICTAENATNTAELQCEHELDIMGCQFVMALSDFYTSNNSFTSCDGDVAAPPGLYPLANGSTSTFRQRYTGSYTQGGSVGYWTVGQTVTPSAPAWIPATSNCYTYSTISNGVNTANWLVASAPSTLSGGSTVAVGNVASTSMSRPSNLPSASSGSGSASGSASRSGSSGSGISASAASVTSNRPSGSAASAGAASGSQAAGSHVVLGMPSFASLAAIAGAVVFGAAAVAL